MCNKTRKENMRNKQGVMPNESGMVVDFNINIDNNQCAFLSALDDMCCAFQRFREITDEEMADALDMYARGKRRDA